jgi:hypothetical protein
VDEEEEEVLILPTIRASFGRQDALHLVDLLGRYDAELRDAAQQRLEEGGIDTLLDDPRVLNALLSEADVNAPPALIFYALVRQMLLEGGIESRDVADFTASLLMAFGRSPRAYRISDNDAEEYRYLVDMVDKLYTASQREAFLLRTHMGDFSLWMSGLFPDYLEARMRRKGGPPIDYYERMGSTGYRMASESPQAGTLGVQQLYKDVARDFTGVREALNRVSDRYLWPSSGDPVARLLREVSGRS